MTSKGRTMETFLVRSCFAFFSKMIFFSRNHFYLHFDSDFLFREKDLSLLSWGLWYVSRFFCGGQWFAVSFFSGDPTVFSGFFLHL